MTDWGDAVGDEALHRTMTDWGEQHWQHARTVPDKIIPGLERKHVMLSHHPSSRAEVVQLKDSLVATGIPVWMAVEMAGADVSDVIAQGVQCAVCVVIFMSQQFQNSDICKLELTFAHSTGCVVLPCLTAQDWRPSGWLATATAGLAITHLYDPATHQYGVAELVAQVLSVAGLSDTMEGRSRGVDMCITTPSMPEHPTTIAAVEATANTALSLSPGTGDVSRRRTNLDDDHRQIDVFISHNWGEDEQGRDNHARAGMLNELLKAEGLRTWFDSEHMTGSINDAMCGGIEQARVVLCLLTVKYIGKVGGRDARDNCRKEFLHASRIKSSDSMLAVVMEPGVQSSNAWHGPVGLELGGHLYVDLADMDESTTGADPAIRLLLSEFSKAVARESSDNTSRAFSVDELRAELERMRQRMLQPSPRPTRRSNAASASLSSRSNPGQGAARLPASVPGAMENMRVTGTMRQIAEAVCDPAARQVGICGMGGVGKSTLSAWVVRQDTVRRRFQAICWVPLGQKPDIEVSLSVLYLQLTKRPLPDGLNDAERDQTITQAFHGKAVLLVVDDAWDLALAKTLMKHVDTDTESKVLISSRLHAVVEGGIVFNLEPPNLEEATTMLLAAAGSSLEDWVDVAAPPEAVEIAGFCNRLPLTISIAGKLLKSMAIGNAGSWDGALELLRDELALSGGSSDVERLVIRVSLDSIAEKHRGQATELLAAFALVPEDATCPLRILGLIFEAATGDPLGLGTTAARRTSQLRLLIKMLIDRSLMLGTVDRPILHAIVADYAVAQHTPMQLAARHAKVVELFREHRPDNSGGWSHELHLQSRPDGAYVLKQTAFHMAGAVRGAADDSKILGWLDDAVDGRLDAISLSAAKVIGWQAGTAHAQAAESAGNWWHAAVRWSSISALAPTDVDRRACAAYASDLLYGWTVSVDNLSIESFDDPSIEGVSRGAIERLTANSIVRVLQAHIPEDLAVYVPRLQTLAGSRAVREDFWLMFFSQAYSPDNLQAYRLGDVQEGARSFTAMVAMIDTYLNGEFPGGIQESTACLARLVRTFGTSNYAMATIPGFDARKMYGEGGIKLMQAAQGFDYDAHYVSLCDIHQAVETRSAGLAFVSHFCEPAQFHQTVDVYLDASMRFAADPRRDRYPGDTISTLNGWPQLLLLARRQDDALDLLRAHGVVNFADIKPAFCELAVKNTFIRPWGSTEVDAHMFVTEQYVWTIQTVWLLIMWDKATSDERRQELLSHATELPSARDWVATRTSAAFNTNLLYGYASLAYPALFYEKVGLLDQALEYVDMAVLPGSTPEQRALGGTEQHRFKAMAHTCQGRIFATLGRRQDAAAAFGRARAVVQSVQYHGFEAVVTREELVCAVDAVAKQAAEERLAGVLQKLNATPKDLDYIRF